MEIGGSGMNQSNPSLQAFSDMIVEAANREVNLRAQLIMTTQRAIDAEQRAAMAEVKLAEMTPQPEIAE